MQATAQMNRSQVHKQIIYLCARADTVINLRRTLLGQPHFSQLLLRRFTQELLEIHGQLGLLSSLL